MSKIKDKENPIFKQNDKVRYFRQSENSSNYQSFDGIVRELGYRRGVATPEWLEVSFKEDLKEGINISQRVPVKSEKTYCKKI